MLARICLRRTVFTGPYNSVLKTREHLKNCRTYTSNSAAEMDEER